MSNERTVAPERRSARRVGRYELVLPLGSGGAATVHLARARGAHGFERDVALKLLHRRFGDGAGSVDELLREARLISQIRHPNVVSVLDVGDDDGDAFLVLEYVEGDSLAGLLRALDAADEPLPVPIALRILGDALEGLHEAHELRDDEGGPLGLVHRDFTPHNILVGVDGVSRLTDFGIAKVRGAGPVTVSGVIKGKLRYMSPEQARGRAIDRRTDVWAAGVIAWELVSGMRLYGSDEDEVALLLRIVSEPPPRLRDLVADVPAAVDDVLARTLSMDPEARPPSAEAFRRELVEAFGGSSAVANRDEVARFVRRVRGEALAERRAAVERVVGSEESTLPAVASAVRAEPPQPPQPLPASPPVVARSWRFLPAVALAIVLVSAGTLARRWPPLSPAPAPSAGAPATSAAVPAAPPTPKTAPSPSPSASAAPSTRPLAVSANAPLALLAIGDHVLEPNPPRAALSLDVAWPSGGDGLELRAVAVDGRTRLQTVPANAASCAIVFAGAKPPPVKTATTAAPSASASAPPEVPKLLPSPYLVP